MMEFRKFRKEMGFNSREMSAIIGCAHTDLTKMERRTNNNRSSIAVFLLLMANFKRNATILQQKWAYLQEPVAGQKRALDIKLAAAKVMTSAKYKRWLRAFDNRCNKYGILPRAD